MAKNVRALTKDELDFLNSKYLFEYVQGYVVTSCAGFGRKVMHDINQGFSLNTPIRKIKITKDAIDFWINEFKDEYTLLDVQNAISSLIVTYQDISLDDIKTVLQRKDSLVKVI